VILAVIHVLQNLVAVSQDHAVQNQYAASHVASQNIMTTIAATKMQFVCHVMQKKAGKVSSLL
jgi:hypothetical protein